MERNGVISFPDVARDSVPARALARFDEFLRAINRFAHGFNYACPAIAAAIICSSTGIALVHAVYFGRECARTIEAGDADVVAAWERAKLYRR